MLIVIYFINIIFQVYTLMLLARILGSWFPQLSQYRFMHFIAYYTDPYLALFRRIIPPLGLFDLSPIVAFLCLNFAQSILIKFLLIFI